MKTHLLYFTVLSIFIFVSCDKQEISETFTLGIEKSFKINGEYQSDDNSMKFKITAVNDSRCPSDVECIWAGMVTVSINVQGRATGMIELNSLNNPIDTIGYYSFELLDVLPYPVSTQTTKLEDYDVKLKIKNLVN